MLSILVSNSDLCFSVIADLEYLGELALYFVCSSGFFHKVNKKVGQSCP